MGPLKALRPQATVALLALLLGWLLWPLLRPRLWPATGPTWLLVLDGYHRLDAALERQARTAEPILLITCPSTGQPSAEQLASQRKLAAPLLVLKEGFDTATQAAALARWLQHRQQQGQPAPRQLLLVSDGHHFPRASLAAQIAVGSGGSSVIPLPARPSSDPPSPVRSPWSWRSWQDNTWRDAVRLQLWRATGSTGAVLHVHQLERKIRACQEQDR